MKRKESQSLFTLTPLLFPHQLILPGYPGVNQKKNILSRFLSLFLTLIFTRRLLYRFSFRHNSIYIHHDCLVSNGWPSFSNCRIDSFEVIVTLKTGACPPFFFDFPRDRYPIFPVCGSLTGLGIFFFLRIQALFREIRIPREFFFFQFQLNIVLGSMDKIHFS